MKIYLTTDTHLGHDRMTEYCGRVRGFESEILLHFRVMPRNSILIHLGDICIGEDEKWHSVLELSTMRCKRRILVRGNHDHKSDQWYLDHGWDFVCEQFTNDYFGKKILFSHKPMIVPADVDFNIHGHFHNSTHRTPEFEDIYCEKHLLLAIENTDLKPVSLEKFISPKSTS